MSPKILLVEDETDFRETLTEVLEIQGYAVTALEDRATFDREYAPGRFDLAILDRTLPDGDGIDILKRIRQHSAMPVILLTGMSQLNERVRGMEADADHYLVKPVDLLEVLSIIRRLLRRASVPATATSDVWQLDLNAWRLRSPAGVEISLTHREMMLLNCFAGRQGEAVHRNDIVKGLGFNPMVYDMRRIETLVSRFRKKLELVGVSGFELQSAYATGYALHVPMIVNL